MIRICKLGFELFGLLSYVMAVTSNMILIIVKSARMSVSSLLPLYFLHQIKL